VFRAEAKGQALEFDTAGVIGGNEVFKDRETGSRWQQSSLESISGRLKGAHLTLYPFLLTSWGEWHRLHPDTVLLKPMPGYIDRLTEENRLIKEGLSGKGQAPPGVLRTDSRLTPKAMVLGLDVEGVNKAYPLKELQKARVVNDRLGKQPVLIVHQPDSDTTTAFLARVNQEAMKFEPADDQAHELTDVETHSRWEAYGNCISGKLKGSHLEALILEPEYWFAWSEFHPGTAIFAAQAAGTR
jgi:Protein of unknown function (DUF3179)